MSMDGSRRWAQRILLGATLLGACSFVAARPTPSGTPRDGSVECVSYVVPGGDIALGLATLLVAAAAAADHYRDRRGNDGQAAVIAGAAAVPVASAIFGFIVLGTCNRAARKRDFAIELTDAARRSAAAGDCGPARELGARVLAADRDYHTQFFQTDAAIRACLEPAPQLS